MSQPQREEKAPSWLDMDFVENSLKKGLKNDGLSIVESEMKLATAAGDHYASQMFRFNLVLKTKKDGLKEKLSIIVKIIPSGLIGEQLRSLAAFEKESEAYSKVLPALNELLKKAYPGHQKLWADCYYHQGPPNDLLFLEDLSVSGFILGNRFEGLDMEHVTLVLKSLAKLHASSLVLNKENPEKLKMFFENFWNPKNQEAMNNFLTTPFKTISKDVLTWPDFDKKELYSKKLQAFEKNLIETVIKLWEIDHSKLNVLLHGDSWVNNFMFKYTPNGKLDGINFVDFQLMNMNSPVLDLQYFIFTSIRLDLRFSNIDLFLQIYHEAFEETLKRFGHRLDKPYTLEQLKKDFEEKYTWGLIVFCCIFPIFLVPSNEVFHPDEFFKADENTGFAKSFKRGNMKDVLKTGLEFFEEKGVF